MRPSNPCPSTSAPATDATFGPGRARRGQSALALAALGLLGWVASGCAESEADAASVVSVFDTGAGEPITLPVPYAVGQSASTATTFDLSIDLDGQSADVSFRLDLSSTVAELIGDGGAVVNTTIDGIEWLASPDGYDTGSFDDAIGVTYAETFDASGKSQSTELLDEDPLSQAQRDAANAILGESQAVSYSFPDGPIAVGAVWTSDETLDTNGIEIPVTYRLELTALDAAQYTIAMSYDSPVDDSADGMDVSGQVQGSGTIIGAVDNPLDVSYDISQDATLDAAQGGTSMSMTMNIDISSDATASGDR